jgi:hypothetical protein
MKPIAPHNNPNHQRRYLSAFFAKNQSLEEKMQLAIEFPDKLFFDLQETLPQQDLKQFVLDAVEAKLLQEKRKQQ